MLSRAFAKDFNQCSLRYSLGYTRSHRRELKLIPPPKEINLRRKDYNYDFPIFLKPNPKAAINEKMLNWQQTMPQNVSSDTTVFNNLFHKPRVWLGRFAYSRQQRDRASRTYQLIHIQALSASPGKQGLIESADLYKSLAIKKPGMP